MGIRRGTAAEEAQPLRRGDGVPCSRRNENGITRGDFPFLPVDLHDAGALEDEVELFAEFVIVPLCRAAGGHASEAAGAGAQNQGRRRPGEVQGTS